MKLLILMMTLSLPAFALETDNFLSWDQTLNDSQKEIDTFINQEIERSLAEANADTKTRNCVQITNHISKGFRSYLIHHNPVENWLMKTLPADKIFPQTIHYVSKSIYRDPFRFFLPKIGLAPNIMVNGIYMGTDKLSHFASTGHHYYVITSLLDGKMTEEEAEEKAVLYGATDEKMVHGYWSSGVFSMADLEANYQGLKFYKNLCSGDKPYLENTSGKWKLVRSPKMSSYVGPLWDESFNHSYYLPENWNKVSPVMKSEYCAKARSFRVIQRMGKYVLRVKPSLSSTLLVKLQIAKAVPVPQSFTKLCLE